MEELDGVRVGQEPAHALRDVEADVRGDRVRVADLHVRPDVGDRVAGLEVAEGDDRGVGGQRGEVLVLDDREPEELRRHVAAETRLPEVLARGHVLELPAGGEEARGHHPRGAGPVPGLQLVDQVDELGVGDGRGARGHELLQRAERAGRVGGGRRRVGEQALGAVGPGRGDGGELGVLGGGDRLGDLGQEPLLDVEGGVVEELLGGVGVRVDVAVHRGELRQGRSVGLGAGIGLADPPGPGAAEAEDLDVVLGGGADDVADAAHRGGVAQDLAELPVEVLGDGHAALGCGADRAGSEGLGLLAGDEVLDERLLLGGLLLDGLVGAGHVRPGGLRLEVVGSSSRRR